MKKELHEKQLNAIELLAPSKNVTIVKASFLITTFASYAISAILYPVTLSGV